MHRRLTLRARMTLLTAAAVALAVAVCAVASWFIVRGQLYSELDGRLRAFSGGPGGKGPPGRYLDEAVEWAVQNCTSQARPQVTGFPAPPSRDIRQVILPDGRACTIRGAGSLVVADADIRVAKGEQSEAVRNGTGVGPNNEHVDVRVLTAPYSLDDGTTVALATAMDLSQVQEPLDRLAVLLVLVAAGGVLVAAGAGLMIARASLRPVDRLTGAVEHIARTTDLGTQIPAEGKDEIARLSRSFNLMTGALAASQERQRMLVADAGHELRTPLTSMRTNIDLLIRSEQTGRPLPPQVRANVLTSLRAQMRELTSLVGDLLQLGGQDGHSRPHGEVALHTVAARAVERARLRGPGLRIEADLKPWYVEGDPDSLERAVMNLLDNAVKFSPPGGTVAVRLDGGNASEPAEPGGPGGPWAELTVRDHGPGVPAEELPYVFERFWRSPSARSMPGSGLGLAIVAQVVREAGGRVALEPAAGGGTLARLRLPGSPAPAE